MEGVLPEVPPAVAGEGDDGEEKGVDVETSVDGGQYRRMLLLEGVDEGGRREEGQGEEIGYSRHAVTATTTSESDTGRVSSIRVD